MKRFIFPMAMMACTAAFAQQPAAVNSGTAPGPIAPRSTVIIEGKATKEQVLKAIAAFRRDPLAARTDGTSALILNFAEASPDVQVEMGPKVLPWMNEPVNDKYGEVLMAAFVAGDVRSQLESHRAKDDAMAGALQVIDTYQQLRKKDPSVRSVSVEKWIALQAQGKLRAELDIRVPPLEPAAAPAPEVK